jgi:hypothetical protein
VKAGDEPGRVPMPSNEGDGGGDDNANCIMLAGEHKLCI